MINKNKRHDNLVLKSNNMMTRQFLLVYFTLIIVLSLFSISSSSAAPVNTQRPTDQSSITYTGDSEEAVPVPATLPTIKTRSTLAIPSQSPYISPAPTETIIEAIILPSPTNIILTPLPIPTKSSMPQILLALLTILSFVGIVFSMILLIANKIKRRRIKPYIIAFLISLAIFIISALFFVCLLYTSPSPRDGLLSRMPSS